MARLSHPTEESAPAHVLVQLAVRELRHQVEGLGVPAHVPAPDRGLEAQLVGLAPHPGPAPCRAVKVPAMRADDTRMPRRAHQPRPQITQLTL